MLISIIFVGMNLKNLILSLSFLLASFATQAQFYTDSTVGIVALYSVGDTAHYKLEKVKITENDNKRSAKLVVNYDIDLIVAEEGEDYKVMHWIYKNAVVKDSGTKDISSTIFTAMSGIKVVYRTDEYGIYQGIINWKEIEKQIHAKLDASIKKTKKFEEATVMKNLKKSLTGEAAISIAAGKEIQTYHSLYGVEFSKSEALMVESEIANAIMPEKPFPAQIVISVDEINTQKGFARLTYQSDIDKEKGGEIITSSVRLLLKEHMPDEMGFTTVVISDRMKFTYSLDKGWMSQTDWNRITEIASQKNMESFSLKLAK